MWYVEVLCKTYNEVDRAFYDAIKNDEPVLNRDQLLRTFQSDIEMIKGYIYVFLKAGMEIF